MYLVHKLGSRQMRQKKQFQPQAITRCSAIYNTNVFVLQKYSFQERSWCQMAVRYCPLSPWAGFVSTLTKVHSHNTHFSTTCLFEHSNFHIFRLVKIVRKCSFLRHDSLLSSLLSFWVGIPIFKALKKM